MGKAIARVWFERFDSWNDGAASGRDLSEMCLQISDAPAIAAI
jgi:hypothetical protein